MSNPIRVLIRGHRGRMGSLVQNAVEGENDLLFVGGAARNDDLSALIKDSRCDVLVDFTAPESVFSGVRIALDHRVSPVIGTSGISPSAIREIESACATRRIGALLAPNFSLGAVILMSLCRIASKRLGKAEIIEMHHDKKVDAPSQTASRTAELIAEQLGGAGAKRDKSNDPEENPEEERVQGVRGGRVAGIPVHSVRLPGLLAHQEVIFGAEGQTLTLRHDTYDRTAFMPGVLLAIRSVQGLDGLVVGLESLLE